MPFKELITTKGIIGMSKIIQVLEQMGQDAIIQTPEALAEFIENSELNEEQQVTLASQDGNALTTLLDVKKDIVCMIFPAEDDEPSEDEDSDDSEDSEDSNSETNAVNFA